MIQDYKQQNLILAYRQIRIEVVKDCHSMQDYLLTSLINKVYQTLSKEWS